MATKENDLEPLEDEITYYDEIPEPLGTNNLSAYAMFEQREYYREDIYPNKFEAPLPFDLWYDRPLFGKVNFQGESIFASKPYLKQIENNVWVLDFVADAFDDFKTEFLFLNKKAVEGTPYGLLTPTRGWSSAAALYDKYMNGVYDTFIEYVDTNKAHNDLITFADFMDVFYKFIDNTSPNIPITFSQFILSRNCPPTISGLMIDISTDGHGNDINKYNHFLNDRNFICFAEAAERFGFKIDKNFPGRLIADINSPVMNRDGNPFLAPSLGGRGYMGRYPKKPTTLITNAMKPIWLEPSSPNDPNSDTYIPPPASHIETPFEPGDNIGVAMIAAPRPGHIGKDYYILRNHTELKNRHQEPPYRSKKTVDGVDWFRRLQFLVNKEKGGTIVPIYGKIISINPTEQEFMSFLIRAFPHIAAGSSGVVYPNYSDGRELALISFDRPLTTGQMGQGIGAIWVGNNDNSLRGASLEVDANDRATGNLTYDADIDGINAYGRINYTSADPQTLNYKTYALIPLDAVHLKNDATVFVKDRFKERINYRLKKEKWDAQIASATAVYDTQKADYDRLISEWEQSQERNQIAWEFYSNPNNRLTLSNLFNRRFGSAYLSDLEMLKEICMQFYYSYVRINPTTTLTKVVSCSTSAWLSKRKVVTREKITQTLINEKYPETYWIKQYILFQNAQAQHKYSFDKLRIIRSRALEIYNKIGFSQSVEYVKKQMTQEQQISTMPFATFKKKS